jgi:hypothetical protein
MKKDIIINIIVLNVAILYIKTTIYIVILGEEKFMSFQIEIKFNVNKIKDINKVLYQIRKQIKNGELAFNDKGEKIKDGYILNK